MVCSCSSWSDGGKLSHHTHCFGMTRPAMVHETLTFSVIGAFFEVYNTLGFGFREHLYIKALDEGARMRLERSHASHPSH